ncbi:BLUF domain-containing protein [Microbacterium sp. cx-55]|nr:BLUF domain-containing protein [Microbacterium sp. cx-55]
MTMTGPDPLLSIVYISAANQSFDDADLSALLEQSRASNAEKGLTGMLLYRGGRFVQVLEGPEGVVRDIFDVIRNDPRHSGVRVMMEEPITERRFRDWTMGFQPMTVSTEQLPDGFRNTFDDLDEDADPTATLRAIRELSLWFRVRSAQRG